MSQSSNVKPTAALRPLVVFGLGTFQAISFSSAVDAQPVFESYPLNSNARHFVTADLNMDGAIDVAVSTGAGLDVLLNDGAGGFLDVVTAPGPGTWIDIADLNGDFAPDVVTTSGQSIQVRMNRGDGTFEDAVIYTAGAGIHGVAIGTIDEDAAPDLAVTTLDGITVAMEWYRNDGAGAFSFADVVPMLQPNDTGDLVAGDFDNDGDTDFAAATRWGYYGKVSDYSYGVSVLVNFGSRSWSVIEIETAGRLGGLPKGLAVGDLDNDGDEDIACEQYDYYKQETLAPILVNDGSGNFRWRQFGPSVFTLSDTFRQGEMAINDYDGDGRLDVATSHVRSWDDVSRIRLDRQTDERLVFEPLINFPLAGSANIRDAGLADVDGDGLHDLLIVTNNPEPVLQVARNEITLGDRPVLDQDPLIAGAPVQFRIANLQPGERVDLAYSFEAPGHSRGVAPLGGMTVDLVEPAYQIAHARADNAGIASITVNVPRRAPRRIVTTQAVVRRGPGGAESVKSNFISAPIMD